MSLETGYAMVIVNQDKKIKEQAEIERLREALHEIYRKCDNDRIMWMVDEALQQKDSE